MLHGTVLVDGVMPDKVANAVISTQLASTKLTVFKSLRMSQSIGTTGKILRAVNGDIARLHATMIFSSMPSLGYQVLLDVDFSIKAGGTFTRCRWH